MAHTVTRTVLADGTQTQYDYDAVDSSGRIKYSTMDQAVYIDGRHAWHGWYRGADGRFGVDPKNKVSPDDWQTACELMDLADSAQEALVEEACRRARKGTTPPAGPDR